MGFLRLEKAMKILLIGSGGREHALAQKLAASPLCEKLFCAPGNAGIAAVAQCVAIRADDVPALVDFSEKEKIDFVVIGPEAPLVAGLADRLQEKGIKAFGPGAKGAQLEGSKGFMKDLCARHNIPTAVYKKFTDAVQAKKYVEGQALPVVVKADGLAAGKGVIIAQTKEEAFAAIADILDRNVFAQKKPSLVIEEFLKGEELSYFVLTDGKNFASFLSAQDHKAAGDGDTGPNTGGMGAYSPAPVLTPALEKKILDTIIAPTVKGLAADGIPFSGVLFAGLMIDGDEPKLLEYNVRFGDPECQVLMARLKSDLLPLLLAVAEGTLDKIKPEWNSRAALCVVMAAKGYPGDYQKGTVIRNIPQGVLHAGTARNEKGELVATGGRVLGAVALGDTVAQAQKAAYAVVDKIDWPQGFCRRDIGWRAVVREARKAVKTA